MGTKVLNDEQIQKSWYLTVLFDSDDIIKKKQKKPLEVRSVIAVCKLMS